MKDSPPVEQFIDKYEVVTTLGRGSMGVVYKARDPEIGRVVAIKTLRTVSLSDDKSGQEMAERFRQEARSAGKLRHPNIVTIFDTGRTSGGSPYIVMEFIEGESLESIISHRSPLDPLEALHYLSQLASAVDYAHSQVVIHRDIKPSNVIVAQSGRPHLLDFGVAKLSDTSLTPAGTVVGTPSYMSPEQIRGDVIDGATDRFSLAVVAFEVFTGVRPFPGTDFTSVVGNIIHQPPLSFVDIGVQLPAGLEKVFQRGLAKDRTKRYPSALEFVEALAQVFRVVVDGLGVPGYRVGMKLAELTGRRIDGRSLTQTVNRADFGLPPLDEVSYPRYIPPAVPELHAVVQQSTASRSDPRIRSGGRKEDQNDEPEHQAPVSNDLVTSVGRAPMVARVDPRPVIAPERGEGSSRRAFGDLHPGDRSSRRGRVWLIAIALLLLVIIGVVGSARFFGSKPREALHSAKYGRSGSSSGERALQALANEKNPYDLSASEVGEADVSTTLPSAIAATHSTIPPSTTLRQAQVVEKREPLTVETIPAASDEALVDLLGSRVGDSQLLARALQESSNRPFERFKRGILALSAHPNYLVRIEAMRSIEKSKQLSDPEVYEAIAARLNDSDRLARGFAVKTLATVSSPTTVSLLEKQLAVERDEVVTRVINASLQRMKAERKPPAPKGGAKQPSAR